MIGNRNQSPVFGMDVLLMASPLPVEHETITPERTNDLTGCDIPKLAVIN